MKKIISILLSFAVVLSVNSIAYADSLSYGTKALGLDLYYEYLVKNNYNNSITIAVIDSGVADIDFLQNKLTPGYDFIYDENDAANDTSSDSHGTTIASIIADATGELPIYIMPVRILEEKNVQIENLVSGIKYAVDNGADVINLSLGGAISDCSEIDEVLKCAYDNNVSVIVAAGNERREISDYCPAHNESAITVSAVDFERKFAKEFSNFGEYVDCCAPGINLIGYNSKGMPQTINGTSFSAALISAGVAMLKLEHPEYSADEIQDKLKSICMDLGEDGFDNYYGYGLPQFNKLISPSISIKNSEKYNNKSIDYKSTIIFTAEAINAPENAEIHWFVNSVAVGKGETYTYAKATDDFNIQVKLIVDNEIVSASTIEKIYVRNTLLDMFFAFVKCLFGMLPSLIQSVA